MGIAGITLGIIFLLLFIVTVVDIKWWLSTIFIIIFIISISMVYYDFTSPVKEVYKYSIVTDSIGSIKFNSPVKFDFYKITPTRPLAVLNYSNLYRKATK